MGSFSKVGDIAANLNPNSGMPRGSFRRHNDNWSVCYGTNMDESLGNSVPILLKNGSEKMVTLIGKIAVKEGQDGSEYFYYSFDGSS